MASPPYSVFALSSTSSIVPAKRNEMCIRDRYIPTAFCAYTGEALDQKTPVLRSMQALNKQALRVLRALGDTETVSVPVSYTHLSAAAVFTRTRALCARVLEILTPWAGHDPRPSGYVFIAEQ